jgi:ADP-heptose:LPS heptosyltransferase
MNEKMIHVMKILDRFLGVPALAVLKAVQAVFGPRPPKEPIRIEKICMIKLWGIGNLVMITPLIRAVRRHYPRARIHFVTLEQNAELLAHLPEIDRLVTFAASGLFRTLYRLMGIAVTLRRIRPDLVLDFEQFLKITPILAYLSCALQTIGFKTGGQARALLYHVKVPYRRNRHMSLAFGDIVRSAGIRTQGLPPVEVPRSAEAEKGVRAYLDSLPSDGGPLVALHLGSGDNFPGRRWPVEKFAALADRLHEEFRARLVLTGTARESALAGACMSGSGAPLHDAMGRFSLMEFIEFLSRVDLLVTNDTAPAHIGAALDVPMIALYGPNTPELYGPLHEQSRVFYHPLPCSPCLTNLNAKTSHCRIPSCILDIEVEEVLPAARELFERSAGRKTKEGAQKGGEA